MKAKTNTLLIVVALLAYWVGLCNASAFYDPGAQRWLNRDPLGERGGVDLFVYVRGDSVNHYDPLGLCRDCDSENKSCVSSCMKKRAPWPYETSDNTDDQNKAARYRYCESKCQKSYMDCLKENGGSYNFIIILDDIAIDILEGIIAIGVTVK